MYEVRTDHQIIALGTEEMRLLDANGTAIVTAVFADSQWTISADGVDDATAEGRQDAVQAMANAAYESLGPNPNAREGVGDGYSTFVPPSILVMD